MRDPKVPNQIHPSNHARKKKKKKQNEETEEKGNKKTFKEMEIKKRKHMLLVANGTTPPSIE
jgi:hypothetical protein